MELSPFLLLLLQQLLGFSVDISYVSLDVLHDPAQNFVGGWLHNPLVEEQECGGGGLVGAEQVAAAEMQGKWLREQQDSWDKAPWGADGVASQDIEQQGQEGDPEISSLSLLKVYTPEVPEGDLANLGQGLVGGDVGGESPEYAGHAQIGEQHYMLFEGMWEG
ncbi:hypothetical protein EDD16DRAFT_1523967 [Pisolithus croceorrhizus]|nr:hypothetical protein EDD16DRAFT_1523967 [Pisolithus croceorrhizus]